MYAIIEDGSAQYKVEPGQRLDIQLRDLPEGAETVEFDKVLFIGDGDKHTIGQPYVAGAKVTASVQEEIKGDKLLTIKFRRRKASRTKMGHRQQYLRVVIDAIQA